MNNEFAEISPTRSLSLSFSLEFSFPRECYTRDKWFATSHLSDFIEWTKVIVFSTRSIRIVYHEYKRGRGEKEGRGGDSIHLVQSNARFHEVRLVSIQLSFVTFELRLFSFSFSFFFFSFFRSISKLGINSLEPARANYSSLKSKAIGSERFFFLFEFYDRFRFSFCLKIIYISLSDLLGTIYRMAYFFFKNFRNQTR